MLCGEAGRLAVPVTYYTAVSNSVSTSDQVCGRDLCIFAVILVTTEIMEWGCPLLRVLCLFFPLLRSWKFTDVSGRKTLARAPCLCPCCWCLDCCGIDDAFSRAFFQVVINACLCGINMFLNKMLGVQWHGKLVWKWEEDVKHWM